MDTAIPAAAPAPKLADELLLEAVAALGIDDGSAVGIAGILVGAKVVGVFEGAVVGSTVGADGAGEGTAVGEDGFDVGATDGSDVGSTDGSIDGLNEGTDVGILEGIDDGSLEGLKDGFPEGTRVGLIVGEDGTAVGFTEGFAE